MIFTLIFINLYKIDESFKMRIRELLKYSAFPLSIILLLICMHFGEKSQSKPTYEFMIWVLIIFFLFISVLTLIYLTLFKFFKKRENGFFYIISIYFFLTLIPVPSIGNTAEMPGVFLLLTIPGYIILTILFSIKMKGNKHLLLFLIASGIILSLYFAANILFIEYKSAMGKLMAVSIALFLIISFGLIFSLPSSNYLDWKREHKQVFLKMVLAPWVLALSILIMNFLINPEINISSRSLNKSNLWNMVDYEINRIDGME
jgi:hypothetical protein